MKKKIFGIALIAIMALAAGWNFTQSKNTVKLSELALANVEALARGEGDPNEGRGMKKENCYYPNGNVSGVRCVSSASSTDICHYVYDQWGKCN